jgi:addiction module HigA family antidote
MENYTLYERIDPIHPGLVLLTEFMEPGNISGNRLAIALGISSSHMYMILNGKRAISVDTAIRLATYFGNSVQFWLNLQSAYDIEISERTGKYAQIVSSVRPASNETSSQPAYA